MLYELTNNYETNLDPNKPIYIMWSGGMDSTALLYAVAKTFRTRKNPIYAISITCDSIISYKKERWIRKQQKKIFKKEKLHIKYINIDIKNVYGKYNRSCQLGSMLQPLLWLSSILFIYKYNNFAQVLFGYVREDDIWHKIYEFKQIFNSNKLFVENTTIELKFPLEWIKKHEIINFLTKYKLINYTSYCEEENIKSCGKCPSCKRVLLARREMEEINE